MQQPNRPVYSAFDVHPASHTDSLCCPALPGNKRRPPIGHSPRMGLSAGWLISRKRVHPACDQVPAWNSLGCLQLATGQWGPPWMATWFPSPGPAIRYALELGHEIGRDVEIIYMQRDNSLRMANAGPT